MTSQHFQTFTFSIKMFRELFSLRFCFKFSSQNRWRFCRRDLSLSETFLEWFLMVWAPSWLPIPSRRPSRRHPKKSLNLIRIFIDFWLFWRPPGGPQNRKKMLGRTWVVVPFWLQKRLGKKMSLQDHVLEHFGFQNWYFGEDFWVFFASYWAVGAATAWHGLPNNALAK